MEMLKAFLKRLFSFEGLVWIVLIVSSAVWLEQYKNASPEDRVEMVQEMKEAMRDLDDDWDD